MCTPLIIAGLALSAGSVVVNSIAASENTKARDNVLAAERIRQQGFDQQAQALNVKSQDRFVDFVPQQKARAQTLGDVLHADVTDPNSGAAGVMPSSSSDIVNQERDKQLAGAQGFVDQQTGAMADLRSFGDLLGETSLMQARDAGQISQIGGFKQGSSGVVPLELDNAGHAGDGWQLLGDILSGSGSVMTGAGISGGANSSWNWFKPPIGTPPPVAVRPSLQVT